MPGGKLVKWENGVPVPVYTEPVTPQSVTKLIRHEYATEYEPLLDPEGNPLFGEDRYIGLTKAEAAAVRFTNASARGDMDATKFIYDRILGKPKQQVETISMTLTLEEFLANEQKFASEEYVTTELPTVLETEWEDVEAEDTPEDDFSDLEALG